jgi:hypothetical protein
MIHSSNETAIDLILFNINNSINEYDIYIDSIIIPDVIDIRKYDQNEFPILSVSNIDFLKLRKFDILEQEENYFILILC